MTRRNIVGFVLLLFLLVFSIQFVSAQDINSFDFVLSNSDDWHDVYSSVIFGNILNKGTGFLASERHANLFLNGVSQQTRMLIVSSEDNMYTIGFPSLAAGRGFITPQEVESDDINLDLAELLPSEINRFIVIDGRLGYDAVSVASYAVLTDAYVLFADEDNIDDVDDFLSSRQVENLLLVGRLDPAVRDTLQSYGPEIVNEGDRFSNNIEVVRKYRQIKPAKQVVLTNGEFLEKEVLSGIEPVLFIGRNDVPQQIREYIQNSDIEIGVLIGNELIGPATNIRRELGISTFVKFARGARSPSAGISQVEGLDLFFLPTAEVTLAIDSVKYNKATSQLEVTYENPGNTDVYLKGTITVEGENGDSQRFGEIDAVFVAAGDLKTITYSDVNLEENTNYLATVYTLFGESPFSLDRALEASLEISFVEVFDDCTVDVTSLEYHKAKDNFVAEVKNTGPVLCYVDMELLDVSIDREKTTIGMEGVESLKSGESKKLTVHAELTEEDIEDNEFIEVRVLYGQRESSLIKQIIKRFELKVVSFDAGLIAIWCVVILLAILIFFLLKKGKKCPHCKTKNSFFAKKCKKCKYKF